ncbi:TrkA C-terminal domain-containing protein [Paenibacillus mendelii]|uniref:RCK C-terminal domain-containing protein n=1 Tax=Paenibacillus mendelii TaxID=206163 RepID=A0ABV6JEA5_9BACL|nr:TrkA C-terminal domain-containing protein [Paenibacillus mendelii]MCQ6562453.1 TrkA C-terminal domain-containing protein [Paenibacillus mendelii]
MYFIVVFLVMEISVSLLVFTGLEPEKSRFQVVSMLTATGFTTEESELILRHPVRRKIGLFLILFGVFSLAVVISTISSILSTSFHLMPLLIGTVCLAAVLLVVKNKKVKEKLSLLLISKMNGDHKIDQIPLEEIIVEEKERMIGIHLQEGSQWIGRMLSDILEHDDAPLPLMIRRESGKITKGCRDQKLLEGDLILFYGDKEQLESLTRSNRKNTEMIMG